MKKRKVTLPSVVKLVSSLYENQELKFPKYSTDPNNILVKCIRESLLKVRIKNTLAVRFERNINVEKCSPKEVDSLVFKISKRAYGLYLQELKNRVKKPFKLDEQYEMDEHIEGTEEKNKALALALLIISASMVLCAIHYILN